MNQFIHDEDIRRASRSKGKAEGLKPGEQRGKADGLKLSEQKGMSGRLCRPDCPSLF